MEFQYLKSLHVIFVVTWFAGLFYIVRLFVYFAEANEKPEAEKQILQTQYKIMQSRLWYGITWPSAILTLIFGSWMIYQVPSFLTQAWFILKLSIVLGLFLYHIQCGSIFHQQKNGIVKYSSFKLRMFNEIATLFLVSIVFIVELQNTLSWLWGLLGIAIFSVILFLAIRMYKKVRNKNQNN